MIVTHTFTDGGQRPQEIAELIIGFLAQARSSLDIALYDVRLPGEIGDAVAAELVAAKARGVTVRLLYNSDGRRAAPVPPPPETKPEILEAVDVQTRGVPGVPDLMHHKYVVRDRKSVWTGSLNWTLDSWSRQENVVAVVEAPEVAFAYSRNFDELWRGQQVAGTGEWDSAVAEAPKIRAWFTPGRGPELSQRIADVIAVARRRVRIASPVLTAGAILATLAEACPRPGLDVRGVCDWTQLRQVFDQWAENPASAWKGPLLARVLEGAHFNGKRSTPYAPDSVRDFMHAKVVVADDITFLGSFNLSRSGEQNAENVLEIHDTATADAMALFIDSVRNRYADVVPPSFSAPGLPRPEPARSG